MCVWNSRGDPRCYTDVCIDGGGILRYCSTSRLYMLMGARHPNGQLAHEPGGEEELVEMLRQHPLTHDYAGHRGIVPAARLVQPALRPGSSAHLQQGRCRRIGLVLPISSAT